MIERQKYPSRKSVELVNNFVQASLISDRLAIVTVLIFLVFYLFFNFFELWVAAVYVGLLAKFLFFPFGERSLTTTRLDQVVDLRHGLGEVTKSYRVPELAQTSVPDLNQKFSRIEVVRWRQPFFRDSSLLHRSIVFAPDNIDERLQSNKSFTYARIMHDVAHAVFKDRIASNVFLAGCFAVGTLAVFSTSNFREDQTGGFVTWLSVGVYWMLVFRMLDFFHVREYRADIFSYNIVGDAIISYLQRMARRQKRTKVRSGWARFIAKNTHPTFRTRHLRLTACIPDFERCPQVMRWATRALRHGIFANLMMLLTIATIYNEIERIEAGLGFHSNLDSDIEETFRILVYYMILASGICFTAYYDFSMVRTIKPIWFLVRSKLAL